MPRFTATIRLEVTAEVASEREFRRLCARWVTNLSGVSVLRWELDLLTRIPRLPPAKMLLHLCTVGNPDHGQFAPVTNPEWHVVASLCEAAEKCRAYIAENEDVIGAGNWSAESGTVVDSAGALVARFCFNRRCWSPEGVELQCLPRHDRNAEKGP